MKSEQAQGVGPIEFGLRDKARGLPNFFRQPKGTRAQTADNWVCDEKVMVKWRENTVMRSDQNQNDLQILKFET